MYVWPLLAEVRRWPGAVTVAVGDTQQSTRSVPDWSPTWDERFEFPWAGDVAVSGVGCCQAEDDPPPCS